MSTPRRAAVLAAGLAVLASAPAFAGPKLAPSKPLVITDKAGDANGINSQSLLVPADPSTATPSQYSAADILSASVGRLDDGRTVTGFKVTLTLSAAPGMAVIYRVQASTPGCATFWVSYNVPAGGSPSTSLRSDCATAGTTVTQDLPPAVIKDATITINLPFSALPKNVKLGQDVAVKLVETKAHATTPAGTPPPANVAPTVPTIDDVDGKGAVYKIGS